MEQKTLNRAVQDSRESWREGGHGHTCTLTDRHRTEIDNWLCQCVDREQRGGRAGLLGRRASV